MEIYGVLAERKYQKWFARFKSGYFVLGDLLNEDCCQIQNKLPKPLEVTKAIISKRLKATEYNQKHGNWMPHKLKARDVERRFGISKMLFEHYKINCLCIGLCDWTTLNAKCHIDNLTNQPNQRQSRISMTPRYGSVFGGIRRTCCVL